MPTPPAIDLDATITAFENICDRLSTVEEAVSTISEHLSFDHMLRPIGPLSPVILDLPSSLKLQLGDEFDDECTDERPNLILRPSLSASFVSVYCNSNATRNEACRAHCDDHYSALYHRYFPEKAEQLIEFDKAGHDDRARCADFGISSSEVYVYRDIDIRCINEVVDENRFSLMWVDEDHADFILCSAKNHTGLREFRDHPTLQQHIRQILKLLCAVGHTPSCLGLIITPCDDVTARYVHAALAFSKVLESDARIRFFEKHRIRKSDEKRVLHYCRRHSMLCQFTKNLERMMDVRRQLPS